MNTDTGPRRSTRESGFSFLEMTVASVMLLMLSYLVATLSVTGMNTQKYSERQARATEITQDVVDAIRRSLGSSIRVLTAGPVGNAYRDMVDLGPRMPRVILGARLPLLATNGRLERDGPTISKTGNELLLARFAWTDEYLTAGGNAYRVDVYRFERIYLTRAGLGPREGRPDGLNLAHWVSEPIADGTHIDSIADPADKAEVLLHLLNATPDVDGLRHSALELAWYVGEDPRVAGTFRQIDGGGDLSSTPVAPRSGSTFTLLSDPHRSDAGLLYYRHHSVATNFAPNVIGVGRFGERSSTSDGFPHGFEVQVVGPASARQVLLHLSLVSTNRYGHPAFQDMQIITDVRDV